MADTLVATSVEGSLDAINLLGPYWSDESIAVVIYVNGDTDITYARTDDKGATWAITVIETGDVYRIASWYDKETPGNFGTLAHIAWMDKAADDVYYITLDVAADSLGTKRTVDSTLTVGSFFSNNRVAITQTVSGNIIVAFSTPSDIECYKSADNFATAGTDIADVFESGGLSDWALLFPANTGDDNDAAALFWDVSSNSITIKMFDDDDGASGSWNENLDSPRSGNADTAHMNMDGSVRHSDKRIMFAWHSNDDTSSDDLFTAEVNVDSIASPSFTSKGAIFANQGESAQVAVVINQQTDPPEVYVAYLKGGAWESTVDVVFHKSTDGMVTWGSEQAYSEGGPDDFRLVHGGRTVGDAGGRVQFAFYHDDQTAIYVNRPNDVEIAASVGAQNIPVTPASLSLAAVAPAVQAGSVSISSPTATVTIAPITPSVQVSGVTLSVPTAVVTLAAVTPSVQSPIILPVTPSVVKPVGVAPTVSTGPVTLSVPVAVLSTVAVAPIVSSPITLPVAPSVVSLAGVTPSVAVGAITVSAPVAVLTLAPIAPAVALSVTIAVPIASLALAAVAPVVSSPITLSVTPAVIAMQAVTPTVAAGLSTVAVPPAVVTMTAVLPAVQAGPITLGVPVASVSLAGVTPAIISATIFPVTPAVISVVAVAPDVVAGATTISVPIAVIKPVAVMPTVLSPITLPVTPSAIKMQAVVPTIVVGASTLSVPIAVVAVSAVAPSVQATVTLAVPVSSISMAAIAPALVTGQILTATPAVLEVVAVAPSVVAGSVTVTAPLAVIQMAAVAPTILSPITLLITPSVITASGAVPVVSSPVTLSVSPAVITLVAIAPIIPGIGGFRERGIARGVEQGVERGV